MSPSAWAALQSPWAAGLIPSRAVAITRANRPLLCVDDDPDARETTNLDADLAGLTGNVEVRRSQLDAQRDYETFEVRTGERAMVAPFDR